MFGNDLTLDGLVDCLIAFKLNNYDNSVIEIENYFKSSLTSGSSNK